MQSWSGSERKVLSDLSARMQKIRRVPWPLQSRKAWRPVSVTTTSREFMSMRPVGPNSPTSYSGRVLRKPATAGDVLEVVRSNQKQRYQLGVQQDGPYFIRAVQGHSRTEVGEENLLEPVSEEQLPDTLLHGTSWNAYESIQQRGLLPGRAQNTGGKGGRHGGKWREGRQHVHFFSDSGGISGQREGSTMLARISTRKAAEQGVRFLIS